MSNQGDAPKRSVLLSELYQKVKDKITERQLETYRNKVKLILSQANKSEEDQIFVDDFLNTIVDIKVQTSKILVPSISQGLQPSNANDHQLQMINNPNGGKLDDIMAQDALPRVIKSNELVVTPVKFEGSRSKARRWLDDYQRAAVSNSWNQATMAKYFQAYLSGSALDWFAVLVQSDATTILSWDEVKDRFSKYYIGKDEDLALERALKDSVQQQNESCGSFIARYARLMTLSDANVSVSKLINAIRIRLKPEIVERLSSHNLTDLETLNNACAGIEDGMRATRASDNMRRRGDKQEGSTSSKTDNKNQKKIICGRCDRPNHHRSDCFATKKKDGSELKDQAPKKPPPKKTNAVSNVSDGEGTSGCEEEDEDKVRPRIVVTKKIATIVASSQKRLTPALLFHQVKLNGHMLKALIDPGSESSIVSSETASMNGWVPAGPKPTLASADNTAMVSFGSILVDLTIEIGDTVKTLEQGKFTVVEGLCCDVILGLEMLGWLKIIVDTERRNISFKNESKNISLGSDEVLAPRSQKVVRALAPKQLQGLSCAIQTTNFNTSNNNLLVANSICEVDEDTVECLVVNLDTKPIKLAKGTQIASYEMLGEHYTPVSRSNATMQIDDSQSFVTIGEELSADQRQDLLELLGKYRAAFSINGELGCTSALEHDIELTDDAKPFSEPMRRRPLSHQIETRRQVKEMLDKGILEESKSPWAAAYVLARKKSGEMRLCIDFRRLNDMTKKCVYPLPNVEDCVETLAGKTFFSQLDMASGFWQLPLAPRARELTAFRTEDGQYQFTRMPFGLTNAPASFQRLVNIVFGGLKGLHLQAFIDDLCIASSSWEEHLTILSQVFSLLIKANLKLKPAKCVLGASQVIFLGHLISKQGIQQDPAKLAALRNMPQPRDVKELRSVLGMLNYYRKFVPSFATLTHPLTQLLKKGRPFVWGEQQQIALDEVLTSLLQNGTLAHFDHALPTALKTDASKIGIACILLQQHQAEWRVVTCRSRMLNPHEQNYGITELEALAVVEGITKLRNYLLGKHFRVITDHCALCAVFKSPSQNARLNRWRLALSEYSFDVVYTRGAMHSDVDCLSRSPLAQIEDDLLDEKILTTRQVASVTTTLATPLNLTEWQSLVSEDEEAKQFTKRAQHRREGFKIFNGLLYKDNRLFVPAVKRQQLLEAAHKSDVSNHGGIKQSLDRLGAFWWPRLNLDVTHMVETCISCQKRKTPRQAPSGVMHSFVASAPFELVAMDVLELTASMSQRIAVAVVVDVFTRFVIAKALKNQQASTFTKMMRQTIGAFGVPRTLLTDNAPFFANEQARQLASELSYEHRMSTARHSQGNAVAERMIQLVQEKLSLLTNQPDRELDWEMSLPYAVLSINTGVCASTGYTPFELMFGRKFELLPNIFKFHDSGLTCYVESKRKRMLEQAERASARQLLAKEKNKERYDARRVPREFEIGDLVLIKRAGRISKLAERWVGPFEVVGRANDIYTLTSNSNRSFQRHVVDMKPYKSTSAVLIIALLQISAANSSNFERSGPVIWVSSDNYASSGFTKFKVRLSIQSPCPLIAQFYANLQEAQVAASRCDQIFSTNIAGRLEFDNKQPKQLLVFPPLPQPPTGQVVRAENARQLNDRLKRNLAHSLAPRTYASVSAGKVGQAENARQWNGRHKRDLALSTAFATYAIVSNVLKAAITRMWPSPAVEELREHDRQTTQALNNLTISLNATQVVLDAVRLAIVNTAKLIQHNADDIADIRYNHPQLTVLSAHIVASVVEYGSLLERLRISFRSRRPDLVVLSQLTGTSFLDAVEPNSVPAISVKATRITALEIELEFAGRVREPQLEVFAVESIDFWHNLTEARPVLLRYAGPKWVIFNAALRCIKGIHEPKHLYVNARCDEPNFEDRALSHWVEVATSPDPWSYSVRSTVIETWPYVHVYCFPHQITRDGQTSDCPPYVFRSNATLAFNTSDGHLYRANTVEYHATADVASDATAVHLRNHSTANNENHTIRKLIEMRNELTKANERLYLLSFQGGGGISYPAILSFSVIIVVGVAAGMVMVVRSRAEERGRHEEFKAAVERGHTELRRIVTDSVYGTKTYETLRRSAKEPMPATVNISVSNSVPTTTAPLPPLPGA